MSPRDDSSQLEAELRRMLLRPSVPPRLGRQVMDNIRAEVRRSVEQGRSPLSGRSWLSVRWVLGAMAGVAVLLLVLLLPRERTRIESEAAALAGDERDLAEVLQLTGSHWNRAQTSAFPLGQGNSDD